MNGEIKRDINILSNIEKLLEQRDKLIKAQEHFSHEYQETKAKEQRVAQQKYFGIVNKIKGVDYQIDLLKMEIELHKELRSG